MKWFDKLRWKYVACANGKCLHTLDDFGKPVYVKVDKDFKGSVYCSIDCMQYFSNIKAMNA